MNDRMKTTKTVEIITCKLLKSWNPCADGYERFCELFPKGADLQTAIDGLAEDGHDDWGYWLFQRCQEKGLFPDTTAQGTGTQGTVTQGTGTQGTGTQDTGTQGTGTQGILIQQHLTSSESLTKIAQVKSGKKHINLVSYFSL